MCVFRRVEYSIYFDLLSITVYSWKDLASLSTLSLHSRYEKLHQIHSVIYDYVFKNF